MPALTKQERYRGSLLGLATGDAVGMTLEFRRPGSFEPIEDMTGGGFAKLEAGQWSDDASTSEALLSKPSRSSNNQVIQWRAIGLRNLPETDQS